MKVLIVGSFDHWNGLERHYVQHLTPLVESIDLFPFPDMIRAHFAKNIPNRILYKFNILTSGKINEINKQLQEEVRLKKPDLVWIFKGIDIQPATLRIIKSMGCKIVNYNADHPFIRTFRSSGGKEIEQCLPLYDKVFCYSRDLMNEIHQRYNGRTATHFLPFGYALSREEMNQVKENAKSNEIQRACFIGNPDTEYRFTLLRDIVNSGIPIDIYGTHWDRYFGQEQKNAKIFPGVYHQSYWDNLARYRVQLNIFRPHNINSHNMRSFEIPAVGGIQVAPDSREHREFFEPRTEIFLYHDSAEMISQLKKILALSSADAQLIRDAAFNRSVLSDYSYDHRAREVANVFTEMMINR